MWNREKINRLFDDTSISLKRVPSARDFRKVNEGAYRYIIGGNYSSDIRGWRDYLTHRGTLDSYLSASEVAKELGFDLLSVYEYAKKGYFSDVIHIGRQIYVSRWMFLEGVVGLTGLDYHYLYGLLQNDGICPMIVEHRNNREIFSIGFSAIKRLMWIAYKQNSLDEKIRRYLFLEPDKRRVNLSEVGRMLGLTREDIRQHKKYLKNRKGPGKTILVDFEDAMRHFSSLPNRSTLVSLGRLKLILGREDLTEELLDDLGAESVLISGKRLFTRKSLRSIFTNGSI